MDIVSQFSSFIRHKLPASIEKVIRHIIIDIICNKPGRLLLYIHLSAKQDKRGYKVSATCKCSRIFPDGF